MGRLPWNVSSVTAGMTRRVERGVLSHAFQPPMPALTMEANMLGAIVCAHICLFPCQEPLQDKTQDFLIRVSPLYPDPCLGLSRYVLLGDSVEVLGCSKEEESGD